MNINYEEIIRRLREPFDSKEIKWKLQDITQDKSQGLAVAHLDVRAVQKRLDEVVGPFNWKNVYSLWHDNSQICGISIFNAERNEWVTKFDGSENGDTITGGLADSFNCASNLWGIGRYLYDMDGVQVEVENKDNSVVFKQDQMSKLETEYNAAVSRIFGDASNKNAAPATPSPKQQDTPADAPLVQQQQAPPTQQSPAQSTPVSANANTQPSDTPANDFKIQSVKPSGKSSQVLELLSGNGDVVKAYVKAGDRAIAPGSRLRGVQMEKKQSSYGEYNLICDYQVAA